VVGDGVVALSGLEVFARAQVEQESEVDAGVMVLLECEAARVGSYAGVQQLRRGVDLPQPLVDGAVQAQRLGLLQVSGLSTQHLQRVLQGRQRLGAGRRGRGHWREGSQRPLVQRLLVHERAQRGQEVVDRAVDALLGGNGLDDGLQLVAEALRLLGADVVTQMLAAADGDVAEVEGVLELLFGDMIVACGRSA